MTITYHSQNRKELVKALSEIIGIPAVYQFMPTCAYKIGECYTVTKSGNLEISDQADHKETERLLAELANLRKQGCPFSGCFSNGFAGHHSIG